MGTSLPLEELERRAAARGGSILVEEGVPKFIRDGIRRAIDELADPPRREPKEHRCPLCGDKHGGLITG